MTTDVFRRDQRYRMDTLAAQVGGISAPMTWAPCWSRVVVGPRQFCLEFFGYGGTRASPEHILAVASNRDYIAVREVTRAEVDNLEDDAEAYEFSPDPWGDANALEAMARQIVGVDSDSIYQTT